MKKLHFLSGLPRSGSTVLTKLLNQNPEIYASSTSPLLEYAMPAANHLHDIKNNHSAGHYVDVQKILSTTAFAFHNTDKKHVIDKNRGWISLYDAVNQELEPNPRIILTLRPIEEVVSSFYKVLNHINDFNETPEQIFIGRVESVYNELMNAARYRDKFCVVTYDQIVNDSGTTLSLIERFIGASSHLYDINNIVDEDPENDEKWGIQGLHTIRQKLENHSLNPSSILTKTELNFCKQLTEDLYNAYEIPLL